MKYIFLILMYLSIQVKGQSSKSSYGTKELKLIWSDEFNLDGLPDSRKWGYEEGFVRGFEKQYYTKAREDNAIVTDGCLVITAKKEVIKNSNYRFAGQLERKSRFLGSYSNTKKDKVPNSVKTKAQEFTEYTSASLTTAGISSWLYGRIEVRAKVPPGKGAWPAVWMLGTNRNEVGWPKCGEIDIMEHIGRMNNRIFATVHNYDNATGKHKAQTGHLILNSVPSDDFHIYSVEWRRDSFKFYFDNKLYYSVPILKDDVAFKKPFYLLINLALGGDFAGPVDETILPQQFLVDYIRIYQ